MPSALFVWCIWYPYPHPGRDTVWYISYPYPHPCLLHCLCVTYDTPMLTHAVTLCGKHDTLTPTLAFCTVCVLLAQLVCDPQMVWECVYVCVCVCVHACVCVWVCVCVWMEWTWSVHYIGMSTSVHFVLCQCIHTQMHFHTIWGLRTDWTESGYCCPPHPPPPPPPPLWLDRNFVLHAPSWVVPKNALWKPALSPLVRITFIDADSDKLDPKVTEYFEEK